LFGSTLVDNFQNPWVQRGVSWLFALALALVALRLWRSARRRGEALVPQERLLRGPDDLDGARWEGTRPRKRTTRPQLFALVVGFFSALLPCGALLLALIAAAGTASPIAGAGFALGFAFGTAPGPLLASTASSFVSRVTKPLVRRGVALVFLGGSLLVAMRPPGDASNACPHHEGMAKTPSASEALTRLLE
jgi:sulfite exporter TauE/SafE